MTRRRFAILDVFTDQPFAGNPLAVVLDSEGLDDSRMQAVAAEFNLSETVFVHPPENPVHSAGIRIFTPGRELPFAGHPTVGAAILLALEQAEENHSKHELMLILEEKVGAVRCGVVVKEEAVGHAVFDLPRHPWEVGPSAEAEPIAEALGLVSAEIGFENHRPSVFSAGAPFVFVPVRDLSTIAKATPDLAAWDAVCGGDLVGAFLYCRQTEENDNDFHARMFAPTAGIPEDPATGSAVAALAGVISRFDQPTDGLHRFTIEQGIEMRRPSLIGLEIDIANGRALAIRIGGDAVVVARGELQQ